MILSWSCMFFNMAAKTHQLLILSCNSLNSINSELKINPIISTESSDKEKEHNYNNNTNTINIFRKERKSYLLLSLLFFCIFIFLLYFFYYNLLVR